MNQQLRKHAFLTSRGLEYRECGEWKIEEFSPLLFPHLDGILWRLYSANRAIWILDDQVAEDLREVAEAFWRNGSDWKAAHFEVKRNAAPSTFDNEEDEPDDTITRLAERENDAQLIDASERVSFRPHGGPAQTKDCQLFFPGKAENWGFSEDDGPETIERALVALQNHFGRSLVYPPGRLAIYLMEQSRERAKEQVDYKRQPSFRRPNNIWRDVGADDLIIGGDDRAPRTFENPFVHLQDDLDWKKLRPLSIAERQKKYVHAFDKNAAFLQAVGIPLGVGDYTYVSRPQVSDCPGLWLVKSISFFSEDRTRLRYFKGMNREMSEWFNPPGFANAIPFSQWVTTPTLKLLCDLDLIVEVEAAWLADDAHKLFPTYYSNIKQVLALCDVSPTGRLMRRFVKGIYTKGIGYLRADFARQANEWFYRPDWWATIVSEATARIFRDAIDVNKAHGVWPIATYIDCLYYVSDEPDAYKAFPIFQEKFGSKFKHKGTCELTPQLANAHGDDVTPGAFGGMFKRGLI
jgi:hypothetical protein